MSRGERRRDTCSTASPIIKLPPANEGWVLQPGSSHMRRMPQARPVSRGLFLDTFLYEHIPEAVDIPGMTVMAYSEPESSPDSLAFTYSQTGVRGVLRSFVESLANLRENIRFWSFLVFRNRMAPSLERDMILSLVLLLVLWGLHLL
ncbi:bcl-2-interacting killer isoform X3 [Erinaceus europaeus]|uniref:Bcl-2-interacting killer isoform X3 n=1 Tax=Erinaceus europaeus TaxID=9365 RepID=A0ABM3X8G2_ERIEU|nr:bcl-2-interacting killer isoform X3 [Erinaceus europaeus]